MMPQEYDQKAEELEQLFRQKAPLLTWSVERWVSGTLVPWYWTIKAEAEISGRSFYAECVIQSYTLDTFSSMHGALVDQKIRQITQAIANFLVSDSEGIDQDE